MDFVFNNRRVNNSPYVIVSGKNHRELIREGLPQEEGLQHNAAVNISLTRNRPDFIKAMGKELNENRFALHDRYDKSTYLTRN